MTVEERNDMGQMLLDPVVLAKQAAGEDFTRYNGGWVKSVTKLDKRQTNGYSLVGDFLKEGLQWLSPGVYLDCSIGGSRKHPAKTYTVFLLKPDGSVEKLGSVEQCRDWAVRLWDIIEDGLNQEGVKSHEEQLQELLARREKIVKELSFLDVAIKVLTEAVEKEEKKTN